MEYADHLGARIDEARLSVSSGTIRFMNDDATYRYDSQEYSREALRNAVEVEAAGLPREQWLFGEFEFDEWLSDCL